MQEGKKPYFGIYKIFRNKIGSFSKFDKNPCILQENPYNKNQEKKSAGGSGSVTYIACKK